MDELIRELKTQGVLKSPNVEAAFRAIDRKDFVRPEYEEVAYANHPLPIGEGQTISQPYTVAFMLDLLDPKAGEKILDVGSGSGWTTALLAHIVSQSGEIDENGGIGTSAAEGGLVGRHQFHQAKPRLPDGQGFTKRSDSPISSGCVFAIELMPELCKFGEANVAKYNFIKKNIAKFLCRDGTLGLRKDAPFDKILTSDAALAVIPPAWREQLRVGRAGGAPGGGAE